MSTAHRAPKRRSATAIAALGVTALALTACAGNGGASSATSFDYLAAVENSIVRDELTALGDGACAANEKALPLKVETLPQADVLQRVTLLASQNALPTTFTAPTAPLRPGGTLGDDDTVLDLEDTLTELGVMDDILPSAVATVKNIYGDRFVSMPYQYNVEGFFYNKTMFTDLGIAVPQTWDELLDAADTVQASGKSAFTVSGAQGWTITRYISTYLFRLLGPDAMNDIASGDAKLTDPEYGEAITAVADLGKYFGAGITTMDMQTATSEFFTGNAAMMYNGTWMLADVYNTELNQIGEDAVGFMPFPTVEGGKGSIDQYPANTGAATSFSTKGYDEEKVGGWLSCIAENYGSSVLKNQGVISGFKLNEEVTDVPALTAEVQGIMADTDETVTWFETFLPEKAGVDAQTNAAPLLTGGISPEDFAALVQAGVDAGLKK